MTRVWPAAAILVLAVARVALSDLFEPPKHHAPTPDEAAPGPYTDDTRALLRDLAPGDDVAGWRVDWVDGAPDEQVRIRLRRDAVSFSVWLVPRGSTPHNPPYSTQTHDLFYGQPDPAETNLPADGVDRILNELVDRLNR